MFPYNYHDRPPAQYRKPGPAHRGYNRHDPPGPSSRCRASMAPDDRTVQNLMPPPKRLTRTEDGLLHVTTFEGFESWLEEEIDTRCVHALKHGIGEEHCSVDRNRLELQSEAGFQAFVFDEPLANFRLRAELQML